jgi:hypothetical protein
MQNNRTEVHSLETWIVQHQHIIVDCPKCCFRLVFKTFVEGFDYFLFEMVSTRMCGHDRRALRIRKSIIVDTDCSNDRTSEVQNLETTRIKDAAYAWVEEVRLCPLDFGILDSPQSAIARITGASFLPLSVNVWAKRGGCRW